MQIQARLPYRWALHFKTMGKDPAFLFYSSDFLTGTMFMTNEQVGLYIRLLCAQHQHGGRIDTNVLRTQCDSITGGNLVADKFSHDERGSFNQRLADEMERRAQKSEAARISVKNRWDKRGVRSKYERNTNVIRSETTNETENKSKIENRKGGAGGKTKPHLFRESEYFDKEVFRLKLQEDERYAAAHVDYYHEVILNWSDDGNRKKDWLATAKNWILRDLKDGKMVDANFNPNNKKRHGSKNDEVLQHGLDQLERIRAGKL